MSVIRDWLKNSRGMSEDEIDRFLEPKFEVDTSVPDDVVDFLKRNDNYIIVGDYDIDGVTSSIILARALINIGKSVSIVIPSKSDGYSLNDKVMNILRNHSGNIILVDNGINENEKIKELNKSKNRVVVIDHHIAHDEPEFLNFHKTGTSAGALAWKVAYNLIGDRSKWMLDLVAMSLIGDVMPLVGENRILAKYGIMVANTGKNSFLSYFIDKEGVIDEYTIGWSINPVINSALRLGFEKLALLSLYKGENIGRLIEINNIRKNMVKNAFKSILNNIIRGNGIVIAVGEFHYGLTGLIANKLKNEFNSVAFAFTKKDEELYVGSGRSNIIDIHSVLEKYDGNMEFGGHKNAVGIRVKKDELYDLIDFLLENAPYIDMEVVNIDINLDKVDEEFLSEYIKLKPFGNGNEEPVIQINDAKFIHTFRFEKDGVMFYTTSPIEPDTKYNVIIKNINDKRILVDVM